MAPIDSGLTEWPPSPPPTCAQAGAMELDMRPLAVRATVSRAISGFKLQCEHRQQQVCAPTVGVRAP